MIVSFRHKGLQQYYEEVNSARLPGAYLRKINRIFNQLDTVTSVSDIQQMGSVIRKLTGDQGITKIRAYFPVYRWERSRRGLYRLSLFLFNLFCCIRLMLSQTNQLCNIS